MNELIKHLVDVACFDVDDNASKLASKILVKMGVFKNEGLIYFTDKYMAYSPY